MEDEEIKITIPDVDINDVDKNDDLLLDDLDVTLDLTDVINETADDTNE